MDTESTSYWCPAETLCGHSASDHATSTHASGSTALLLLSLSSSQSSHWFQHKHLWGWSWVLFSLRNLLCLDFLPSVLTLPPLLKLLSKRNVIIFNGAKTGSLWLPPQAFVFIFHFAIVPMNGRLTKGVPLPLISSLCQVSVVLSVYSMLVQLCYCWITFLLCEASTRVLAAFCWC